MATKHTVSKRKTARPSARKAVASVKTVARKAVAAVRGTTRKAPIASKSKSSASSRSFSR
jgi:hypothetical protein